MGIKQFVFSIGIGLTYGCFLSSSFAYYPTIEEDKENVVETSYYDKLNLYLKSLKQLNPPTYCHFRDLGNISKQENVQDQHVKQFRSRVVKAMRFFDRHYKLEVPVESVYQFMHELEKATEACHAGTLSPDFRGLELKISETITQKVPVQFGEGCHAYLDLKLLGKGGFKTVSKIASFRHWKKMALALLSKNLAEKPSAEESSSEAKQNENEIRVYKKIKDLPISERMGLEFAYSVSEKEFLKEVYDMDLIATIPDYDYSKGELSEKELEDLYELVDNEDVEGVRSFLYKKAEEKKRQKEELKKKLSLSTTQEEYQKRFDKYREAKKSGQFLATEAAKLNYYFSTPLLLEAGRQVTHGIKSLHKLGFEHRDVKLENVLIRLPKAHASAGTKKDTLKVALTDFGLVKIKGDEEGSSLAGTAVYMPPESGIKDSSKAASKKVVSFGKGDVFSWASSFWTLYYPLIRTHTEYPSVPWIEAPEVFCPGVDWGNMNDFEKWSECKKKGVEVLYQEDTMEEKYHSIKPLLLRALDPNPESRISSRTLANAMDYVAAKYSEGTVQEVRAPKEAFIHALKDKVPHFQDLEFKQVKAKFEQKEKPSYVLYVDNCFKAGCQLMLGFLGPTGAPQVKALDVNTLDPGAIQKEISYLQSLGYLPLDVGSPKELRDSQGRPARSSTL